MDPILGELRSVAEQLTYHQPEIPFISTVTNDVPVTEPEYWVRHARHTVRFAHAVQQVHDQGVDTIIEIGPDAILTALVEDATPTMRRDRSETETVVTALGQLHARVDWPAFFDNTNAQPVELPTYPFQRERYWLDTNQAWLGMRRVEHPVLGAAVTIAATGEELLTGTLSAVTHPWLAVHGIVPDGALLDLAITAVADTDRPTIAKLTVHTPIPVPTEGVVSLQVGVGRTGSLAIRARPRTGTGCCTPKASPSPAGPGSPPADARAGTEVDVRIPDSEQDLLFPPALLPHRAGKVVARWDGVRRYAPIPAEARLHIDGDTMVVTDRAGTVVASVDAVVRRELRAAELRTVHAKTRCSRSTGHP